MTDARLLKNAELLLGWSAFLETGRLSFADYVYASAKASKGLLDHQTEGELHGLANSGAAGVGADAAGHSLRVPAGPLEVAV